MQCVKASAVIMLLSLAALWPNPTWAMTIEHFDRMVAEDQRHYVMFLVSEAKKLLSEQGQSELAKQLERLFRDIPSGEARSAGERQFETSLGAARASKIRFSLRHARSGEVEFAFVDALFHLGIKPAPAFLTTFGRATHNRVFFQKDLSNPAVRK